MDCDALGQQTVMGLGLGVGFFKWLKDLVVGS